LHAVAAKVAEETELLAVLDSFGDGGQAQGAAQVDDASDHGSPLGVHGDAVHEGLVDLDDDPTVNLAIAATVFPLVFLGELPDKTMFASLVLASRGRPFAVWAGAAAAFTVHVTIAVSVGVALFKILPHQAVDGLVASLFLAGSIYSFLIRNQEEERAEVREPPSGWRTSLTASAVIFVAEWGDLTQIITANLAARYHDPLSVGIGALLALWAVAGIAVVSGTGLLRVLSVRTLRIATSVVLVALAAYSTVTAIRA
jgi:Ca2+/H+ antiporter, TMEM165/GDT1 family